MADSGVVCTVAGRNRLKSKFQFGTVVRSDPFVSMELLPKLLALVPLSQLNLQGCHCALGPCLVLQIKRSTSGHRLDWTALFALTDLELHSGVGLSRSSSSPPDLPR